MAMMETKALLAEYRRGIDAFAQLVSGWSIDRATRQLASSPGDTYLSAVKKGIRTSYEYIVWVQKSAGLPRLSLPNYLSELETAGLKTVTSTIKLLGPFAGECLSGLSDDQLKYRPVRDYTLEQMLEHAIVSIWLLVGQLED